MSKLDFYSSNTTSCLAGLRDSFLKELFHFSSGSKLKELYGIFTDPKWGKVIKLKFFTPNGKLKNKVYLIMVQCYQDWAMITLGQTYGFPRGFPILWIPQQKIQTWGFYPKFENDDDLKMVSDDVSDFTNLKEIQFFKKWSGFLGQLITFEYNGQVYWTATSKNSADSNSEFVQDAARLFSPFCSTKLVRNLNNQNLHICAEMMSKKDQKHGALVLQETPVVTCIGKGSIGNLTDYHQTCSGENQFVDFMSHKQVVEFCQHNGLPCDSAIIVKGAAAEQFMSTLSSQRDQMNDELLNMMIEEHTDSVEVVQGTVTHANILGNDLEGLVIKIKYQDVTIDASSESFTKTKKYQGTASSESFTKTKKYKFPRYTVRTMSLRGPLSDMTPLITEDALLNFRKYVNRWCTTVEGKEYWLKFQTACAVILNKGTHPRFVPSNQVGMHIQIANYVMTLDSVTIDAFHQEYMSQISTTCKFQSTVILALGGIGSGKSTVIGKLVKTNPDVFVEVDGDILDLSSMQDVLSLSSERNDYSLWKILEVLMNGKIPCVSLGGGVLYQVTGFGKKKSMEFALTKRIEQVLNIKVKILLLLPTDGEFTNITPFDESVHNFRYSYDSLENVDTAIRRRLSTGDWILGDENFHQVKGKSLAQLKEDPDYVEQATIAFCHKIRGISQNNVRFALDMMSIADKVFVFPLISSENYLVDLDFSMIIPDLIIPSSNFTQGKFMQHRILVFLPTAGKFHHITVGFDETRQMSIDLDNFESINHKLLSLSNNSGIKVYLKGKRGGQPVKTCSFIMVNNLDDIVQEQAAHVTLDSGSHSPAKIRDLTKAIRKGDLEITIDGIHYDLSTRSEELVNLQMHKAFAI